MLTLQSVAVVEVSQTLLLVLMHSIWQAAIVALVIGGILRLIPAKKSDLRYLVTASSLLFLVMAVLTTWSILRLESPTADSEPVVEAVHALPLGNASERIEEKAPGFRLPSLRGFTPWIVAMWAIGAVVMLLRAFRGLAEVKILLSETAATEEETSVLNRLRSELGQLCHSLGMRQSVTLQRCSNLASPAVVGIFWPVILVPASMLAGNALTKEQWRIVLAHELAHVRRFDGIVNLAQLLVESALFFNPGVWWISRQIRIEREVCCDALSARVTGQPLSVARTLLSVAETINRTASETGSTRQHVPASALAFADTSGSGLLRDRVDRLAKPDRAPRSRISWIGFTWVGLMLSVIILVGAVFALQQGTDVVVRSAAAMLSPQERVDELARLQAENTGVYAPPADGRPTDGSDPADVPQGTISVHIVVRTEDGSPIPDGVNVVAGLRRHQYSSSATLASERDAVPSLEFDHEFEFGLLKVAASANGFAPAISEQLNLRPDTKDPSVDLVLTKGFDQEMRVVDVEGQPVSGVEVDVWGQLNAGNMRMGLSDARSNPVAQEGVIHVENLSEDATYKFTVRSAGWEFLQFNQPVRRNEQTVLTLRRVQPTPLQIVDAESGAPVAGALIQVSGWNSLRDTNSPTPRLGDPREASLTDDSWVFGTSDSSGNAVIDMLDRDMKYLLVVRADGYQPELLGQVRAGVSPGTIELSKAIVFEGQVVGDLSKLPGRRHNGQQVRKLPYRNDLKFDSHNYSGLLYVPLDEEGRFRIENLLPGGMEFSVPGGTVAMSTDQSRNGIVLNLEEIAAETAAGETPPELRDVVVRFKGLKQDAEVRGALQFQWQENGRWKLQPVAVVDRSATLSLPMNTQVLVREKGLVGCVFQDTRIDVVEGDGLQVFEIPAQPAGGVFGTVRRNDGTAADSAGITIIEIEEAPSGRVDPNPSIAGHSSSFFRTVPFGGTYAVLAREFTDDHAVWAVSQTFRIDENNPIQELELELGAGEPTTIRILDNAGKPVPGAAVSLSIGLSANQHSYGQATGGVTDDSGLARLGRVQLRGNAGDAEVTISAEVHPMSGLTGWRDMLNASKNDFTIRLDTAVTARGIVIDAATNSPIPKAEVVVYPRNFRAARYVNHIRTKTDANGRFEFDGLEPIEYQVTIQGTAALGTVIIPQPNGGVRYEYPNGPTQQLLTGGSDREHTYKVQIVPGSSLKPVE